MIRKSPTFADGNDALVLYSDAPLHQGRAGAVGDAGVLNENVVVRTECRAGQGKAECDEGWVFHSL